MSILYFAHNGVEHATANEATSHEEGSNLLVILAVTAVALAAMWIIVKLLSKIDDKPAPKQKDKK